jgi:hypothetical protein
MGSHGEQRTIYIVSVKISEGNGKFGKPMCICVVNILIYLQEIQTQDRIQCQAVAKSVGTFGLPKRR